MNTNEETRGAMISMGLIGIILFLVGLGLVIFGKSDLLIAGCVSLFFGATAVVNSGTYLAATANADQYNNKPTDVR